jgi:Family of unknown function (DUF6011)
MKYKWVRSGSDKLYNVGILDDGTLHNPRGYPADMVRSAVLAAIERSRQRRSEAAKKAAKTRALRQERKVYAIAQKLQLGHKYGPSSICVVCDKDLADPESIERGIGSDCWQKVMAKLTELTRPAAGAAAKA